ncbi:MAG: hypothetical protein KDK40_02375, partial [Chlamydiia bacterium]|nr:hypothetical protein [Chlamydiia bacterium]
MSRYRPSNQTIPSVATRKPLSEETHSTLPTEPASDSKQPSSEAPQIDHEPTIQIQNSDQTPSSPPTHPDVQPQSFQQPSPQYYSGTKSSPKARIYVNSGTDKNGRISKSLSQFPTNQPELYVDLVIDNGEPGEVTQLTLQHLNSGGAVSAQDQM